MYIVGVTVEFEDGTAEQRQFDFWGDACAWIEELANSGISLPKKVDMWILRYEVTK